MKKLRRIGVRRLFDGYLRIADGHLFSTLFSYGYSPNKYAENTTKIFARNHANNQTDKPKTPNEERWK